jgi:hypothetical protein
MVLDSSLQRWWNNSSCWKDVEGSHRQPKPQLLAFPIFSDGDAVIKRSSPRSRHRTDYLSFTAVPQHFPLTAKSVARPIETICSSRFWLATMRSGRCWRLWIQVMCKYFLEVIKSKQFTWLWFHSNVSYPAPDSVYIAIGSSAAPCSSQCFVK